MTPFCPLLRKEWNLPAAAIDTVGTFCTYCIPKLLRKEWTFSRFPDSFGRSGIVPSPLTPSEGVGVWLPKREGTRRRWGGSRSLYYSTAKNVANAKVALQLNLPGHRTCLREYRKKMQGVIDP